jgi:hypothetical protein
MIGQHPYRYLIVPALAAAIPLRPVAAAEGFQLMVTGTANLAFTASCNIIDERGHEHWAGNLDGAVPQAFVLLGVAVACEVRKEDRRGLLWVRLDNQLGTVAEAGTSARFGEVAVRSQGPWGPRQATVTTEPLHPGFPQPNLPGLGAPSPPIVPPLKGQTVPPLR